MKRLIIAAALAGTTIAGAAIAQNVAQNGTQAAVRAPRHAMALDLDKDGVITRAEVTAAADARFAQLDANRDGKVSAGERPNKRGGNAPDMTREQLRARALARFDRADGDKDGRIEPAERPAMRGARGRNAIGMRGPDRGGPGGPDGPRRHGAREGGAMRAMMMADTNRDGVITRAEMTTAAQAMFDRIDTNRDGRIDAPEREAARRTMMPRGPGPHGPGPNGLEGRR